LNVVDVGHDEVVCDGGNASGTKQMEGRGGWQLFMADSKL
jgi:hypothetical protein